MIDDDIAAFVRARLDEDEQFAAAPGLDGMWAAFTTAEYLPDQVSNYASRQSPARTRRAVAAKRRVLDEHAAAELVADLVGDDPEQSARIEARRATVGALLRAVAREWHTHADYRKEWER